MNNQLQDTDNFQKIIKDIAKTIKEIYTKFTTFKHLLEQNRGMISGPKSFPTNNKSIKSDNISRIQFFSEGDLNGWEY
jgi:hypothetical protein